MAARKRKKEREREFCVHDETRKRHKERKIEREGGDRDDQCENKKR